MPELNYAPDPRPQPPTTALSRSLGGRSFNGLVTINHAGAISTQWIRRSADTQGVSLECSKKGANGNADAAVAANNGIFQLRGFGWNGSAFVSAGRIQLNVSPVGAFSLTNSGSYVRLQTVAPNTSNEAESFRTFFSASAEPMLTLGGVAAAAVGLKSAGAGVMHVRLADDSNYAALHASLFGVAGTQVVGARDTGWTTFTGAVTKNAGGFDTGTCTTAQLASVVKSMLDALVTHGLLGA